MRRIVKLLYLNPERFDYLHAQLLRGLGNSSSVFLTTLNLGNYGALGRCLEGELPKSVDSFGWYDAVLVGTSGRLGMIPEEWIGFVLEAKKHGSVIALIDSCDAGAIPIDRRTLRNFDIVFKRELVDIDNSITNVVRSLLCPWWKKEFTGVLASSLVRFPMTIAGSQRRPSVIPRRGWTSFGIKSANVMGLPIGIEDRCVQSMNFETRIEVSCTLTPNTGDRSKLLQFLDKNLRDKVLLSVVKDKSAEDLDLVVSGAVSPLRKLDHEHLQNYFDLLRNSRASISYPGGGFDTARTWEILSSGSLLISPTIPLTMSNRLEPWKHYIPFQGLQGLREAVEFVWQNPSIADEIRTRGYKFAIRHHSEIAHAGFVLGLITEKVAQISKIS